MTPRTVESIVANTAAPIDMTRTMAPDVEGFREHMRGALAAVAESEDLATLIQRHRFFGTTRDRELAASWLAKRLGTAPPVERILVTGGTQNSLMILLRSLVGSNGSLATEKYTYAAIGQLGKVLDVNVVGIELDEYGLVPDHFAKVCRDSNVKALYCNPTGHNPTTSIMPVERREALARIARQHNVQIFEDDVHGMITSDAPRPISTFAPELTWYIMTMSKCLGIGLRTAFMVGPSVQAVEGLLAPIPSISAWFVPGLSAALISHLIDTGAADQVARRIGQEIAARQDIAQEILGPLKVMKTNRSSLHVWVDLPEKWSIDEFVSAAGEKGVTVRNPKVFASQGYSISRNIRLSMIAPQRHNDLRAGLGIIKELLVQ